jgi:hypothetical protein
MTPGASSPCQGPAEALRDELVALGYANVPPAQDVAQIHSFIHTLGDGRPTALCLSGGGIRSATFGLGVLQGLARGGLLEKVHYLSTVSGGGYIGSWLSAWIKRKGASQVIAELKAPRTAAAPELKQVQHLRSYTNYLDPRLGWLSADTWTLFATYMRNLLLNWAMLVPLLLAVLAMPRLLVALAELQFSAGSATVAWVQWSAWVALIVALLYVAICQWTPVRSNRSPAAAAILDQRGFLWCCLTPLVWATAAFAATWAWASNTRRPAWTPVAFLQDHELVPLGPVKEWADLYACFTVPALLIVFLLAVTVYVGLTNRFRWSTDEDLEWWARVGAWILIPTVFWLGSTLVVFGPRVAVGLWTTYGWTANGGVGALGALSGLISILGGKSGRTAAPGTEGRPQGGKLSGGLTDWLLAHATVVAAPVFIVFLIIGLAMLTNVLMRLLGEFLNVHPLGIEWDHAALLLPPAAWHENVIFEAPPKLVVAFILLAAVIGVIAAFFVNVNKFSLHAMYRNRLIRAYLGASNEERRPDWFTGFDDHDNIQMHQIHEERPLHVVNMALNLVHSKNLAWQERKAASFTVSRLHCGNAGLGYRRSGAYGSNKQGSIGISLGTAMAISGAAASPNMGYHSSPPVTFLMTLFNARLGWWLGNPGPAGERTYRRWGPKFAIGPMVVEMFGLTDDTRRYVYLSDGGHFENLGLYEMVARRCGRVIAVDAGYDPECAFEDLGNAIRKIRTDLGIPVTFTTININPRTSQTKGDYCAVGDIHYEAVDQHATPGKLLYVKPCFYKTDEPLDVRNYAEAHPAFPHEPTSDQWFSESQFESYRALGQYVIEKILGDANVRRQMGF